VVGELALRRRIVHQDGLAGPQHVVEDGFRQVIGGHRRLTLDDVHAVVAHLGLGFDPIGFTARQDQQSALRAGVLEGEAHDHGDQALQVRLAGHRLQHLQHGREIQMLDRSLERAWLPGAGIVCSEVRIPLLELTHLAVGAPLQIAVTRVSQVDLRDLVERAGFVEVAC
jgi:hypothetical protein